MTAKEFWNTQIPTDVNKCYVHDFYAKKFSHEDLFRFAEAYASLKVAEATKEMYPKAYTRWLFWNEYFMTEEGLISPVKNMPKGTLDELFEYWKENIQGK